MDAQEARYRAREGVGVGVCSTAVPGAHRRPLRRSRGAAESPGQRGGLQRACCWPTGGVQVMKFMPAGPCAAKGTLVHVTIRPDDVGDHLGEVVVALLDADDIVVPLVCDQRRRVGPPPDTVPPSGYTAQ